MWWTTITIALVATYFEWTYRKKKRSANESEEAKSPAGRQADTSENAKTARKEVS